MSEQGTAHDKNFQAQGEEIAVPTKEAHARERESSAKRHVNLTQVHVVHVLLSIFEEVDHVLDIVWREDVEGHHKYKVPGLTDLAMRLVDGVTEEQKVETDDRRDDLILGFSQISV